MDIIEQRRVKNVSDMDVDSPESKKSVNKGLNVSESETVMTAQKKEMM